MDICLHTIWKRAMSWNRMKSSIFFILMEGTTWVPHLKSWELSKNKWSLEKRATVMENTGHELCSLMMMTQMERQKMGKFLYIGGYCWLFPLVGFGLGLFWKEFMSCLTAWIQKVASSNKALSLLSLLLLSLNSFKTT